MTLRPPGTPPRRPPNRRRPRRAAPIIVGPGPGPVAHVRRSSSSASRRSSRCSGTGPITTPAFPATEPDPPLVATVPPTPAPEGVSPATPIGQTETGIPVIAPARDARPIGVMARPGDAVGRDPWRLPQDRFRPCVAATGPDPRPCVAATGRRPLPVRSRHPTAAHLFPPAAPSRPTPSAIPLGPPSGPSAGPHIEPTPVLAGAVAVAETATGAPEIVAPPMVEPPVATVAADAVASPVVAPSARRQDPQAVPVLEPEPPASPSRTRRAGDDKAGRSRPTTTRTRTRRTAPPSASAKAPAAKAAAPRTMSRTARTRTRRAPVPVPAAAYCPYCATRLDPPPTTSKRCDRCRQKIVVKRINGAVVFLTEAAVLVFDAQRERGRNSARWVRDRDRWLGFAAAAGAPAERVRQVAVGPPLGGCRRGRAQAVRQHSGPGVPSRAQRTRLGHGRPSPARGGRGPASDRRRAAVRRSRTW